MLNDLPFDAEMFFFHSNEKGLKLFLKSIWQSESLIEIKQKICLMIFNIPIVW